MAMSIAMLVYQRVITRVMILDDHVGFPIAMFDDNDPDQPWKQLGDANIPRCYG